MLATQDETESMETGSAPKTAEKAFGSSKKASLNVAPIEGETDGQTMARTILDPSVRHALSASAFAGQAFGTSVEAGITEFAGYVRSAGGRAEGGDLSMTSQMLTAQAITLDTMFSEFARRAALNVSEYLEAAERYGRLAMKAQSNCRATLEALAKLHQPCEQTVRHVQVNEGGQAIVADQFHQHMGAPENDKSVKQSHATRKAGECAALPCPDPPRDGVPIAGGERQAEMQDARRHKSGRA